MSIIQKLFWTTFSLLLASVAWAHPDAYDYPLENTYAATVVGTPSPHKASLPEDIRVKNLKMTVFKDRVIPDVFWYQDKLRYSLAYQKKNAPLIFIIAGTGADYNSSTMQILQAAFYNAGFHVISLPSPTHPNFIITASTSMVPGNILEDSRDLYRVMELAWKQVQNRIEISEFFLTGYSLGGTQAAFVSKLDEEERLFDFKKVLMINPSVNLYNSVLILDEMLEKNIPGGLDNFNEFFEEMMGKVSKIYKTMDYIDFDDDFLYKVYQRHLSDESKLAALIGLAFRILSSNMVFTSDVLTKSGFIVPPNRILSDSDSLTDYFKVSVKTGFKDYFNEYFYPHFKIQQPGLTPQTLIERMGVKSIESYLNRADKIALMTNEDDFILAPGEVDYIRQVFGNRAKIYPRGGHCGNMSHKDNIEYMIGFFKK